MTTRNKIKNKSEVSWTCIWNLFKSVMNNFGIYWAEKDWYQGIWPQKESCITLYLMGYKFEQFWGGPHPPLKTLKMKLQSQVRVCPVHLNYFQLADADMCNSIIHVYLHGFKLKISLTVTFDWIVTQRWVRGQSGGSWEWQTQLDHSQICSTCISRIYTCKMPPPMLP